MEKRDLIMNIAKDLTIAIIENDPGMLGTPKTGSQGRAEEQAKNIGTLYEALVKNVSKAINDNQI